MIKTRKGYDFDDLLLIPKQSNIVHRDLVDLSVYLRQFNLDIPIIASPMKGIISPEIIIEISKLGGLGILHRFWHDSSSMVKVRLETIRRLSKECKRFGVAVALQDPDIEAVLAFNPDVVCIDITNGNLSSLRRYVEEIFSLICNNKLDIMIMAGNVATLDAANALYESGAGLVRVGIGSGALCTTRSVTGVGVPQLTAINDCSESGAYIVADGGIRNSGDIVKALSCGADVVMIGSILAKSYESEHNGVIYGMASRKMQEEYYHSVKSVEGLEHDVKKQVNLKDLIDELVWGIRSACTYLDIAQISELRDNAYFIETGRGSIR